MEDLKIIENPRCNGKKGDVIIAAISKIGKLQAELLTLQDRYNEMEKKQELTEEVSDDIAQYVCSHIQEMYPDAWKLIGASAKRSIKGSITNAWNFHIKQALTKPKAKEA